MAIVVPADGAIISAGTFGKPVADEINRMTPITTVTAWTALTLLNGWVNYDPATYDIASFRKVGDVVQVRGLVRNGTQPIVATLPVGFRPYRNCGFAIPGTNPIPTNGNIPQLAVSTAGSLSLYDTTNTVVHFGFVQFSTIG